MKEFKANEKSQIIAMAKFLYQNYVVKREKVQAQLETVKDKFDFDGKLAAYKQKLEEQYNERTKTLRAKIDEYKEQEEVMSGPIQTLLLDGHNINEVVTVGYVSDGDGKRRLTATLKYPDTVLPPEDNLGIEESVDEGPEYDGAGFNGSAEELAADMEQERLADEARADAMHDCEEREADIDVDMQGEFKPIEEGPAMPPMDVVMQDVDDIVDAAHDLAEKYPVQATLYNELADQAQNEKPDYYIPEETKEMGDSFAEAMQQVVESDPVSQEEMEALRREADEIEAMLDDHSTDDDDSESPWDDDEDDASDEDDGEDDDPFSVL